MNIPLLYLLECAGIQADTAGIAGNVLVRSVRLLPSARQKGQALENSVLYVGPALADEYPAFLASEKPEAPRNAYFLLSTQNQPAPPVIENGVVGKANNVVFANFDVYETFDRAVHACFSYQEWLEQFTLLLQNEHNADELMKHCSSIFGNAAYMVDSSFKVIAIDDSPLFCEISHIWKHLVEEGYLLYDIVYSMQASNQLDELIASDAAAICESEYFNNPFINYAMMSSSTPLGHFFVVGYQKRITPGEVALANLIGRKLAKYVERFGLSQGQTAAYEPFIRRLMEDAPMDAGDIARQIAPWGWRPTDKLCAIAVGEPAGDVHLGNILQKQLDHELGIKTVSAGKYLIGLANAHAVSPSGDLSSHVKTPGNRQGPKHREETPNRERLTKPQSLDEPLQAFLERHRCSAGASDVFDATACKGCYFDQAKFALACLRDRQASSTSPFPPRTSDAPESLRLLSFDDCFSESLVRWLRQQNSLDVFADPRIAALYELDEKNGTEYVRTLEEYLKNERHLGETAAKLFIHRNTLLYRIGRLKEMLADDMEDPEVRIRLLLSIRALCR